MNCNEDCCSHGEGRVAVQTLEEMEFERGLLGAAKDGDLQKVRSLLIKAHDPNKRDQYGYTPLHYAARAGHLKVVEELLSHGASPDAQTDGGATAAHRAAFAGQKNVLDILVTLMKKNGTINAVDDDGDTIAHKAAKGGRFSLAKDIVRECPELADVKNRRGLLWKDVP